jgi:dethiobiotin synthetase
MLQKLPLPGLFITGTDTGVGKTIVAGAIARWFHDQAHRVAVLKPIATGCPHRREGLVSEDAEWLAHCADARHPLDLICPLRYAEPLAPTVAADREKRPIEWDAVQRSINLMSKDSDVFVVEGVGGVMVPLDDKHTVLDLASWLDLPAVIVARPALGTINHTLLTLQALRSRNIPIAGVVINRFHTDGATIAEETNPRVIEKWGKVPVLCILPDEPIPTTPTSHPIPPGILAAIRTVDWSRFAHLTPEPNKPE